LTILRILHISQGGLPDLRIEKNALTMKKEGHELVFLGSTKVKYQNLQAFDRVNHQPIKNDLDLALNPIVKRRWRERIDKINPDIVHAHNAPVAQFLLGSDYPVIYDDHEYWSKQTFKFKERKMPRGIASRPIVHLIPKWERALVQRYPTLTTTFNTANEHRRIGRWVKVTRNVPLLQQIKDLPVVERSNDLVYLGCDYNRPKFHAHRNMKGLRKVIDFQIVCGLTHRTMMEKLTEFKIGLTPWLLHPWHKYSDANRNYEYLHAGLQVVVNREIKPLFKENPYVHPFNNYKNIREIIDSIPEEDTTRIMKYAQDTYLWENQERIIREAYKIA